MKKKDFLKLSDLTLSEHKKLFARAHALKASRKAHKVENTLAGRTLICIFEKASTRTRLSFESAMNQLGGNAITLPMADSQMARGEPLEDTARVVAGYADAIMVRTFGDERLQIFAKYSRVPVINGLTDSGHPVQLLADLFTIEERLGSVQGKTIAYVGDSSSNMGRSFVEAAGIFDFSLRLASPTEYRPPAAELNAAKKNVSVFDHPDEAVRGADVIVTDVWTSMGQEAESAKRLKAFAGYCVDSKLLSLAKPSAIVLHCLPAHRGEEITGEVLDGPQSAAWDEAENRMHVQKALLEHLLLS
jgi:ornithine carbamoyltransferase